MFKTIRTRRVKVPNPAEMPVPLLPTMQPQPVPSKPNAWTCPKGHSPEHYRVNKLGHHVCRECRKLAQRARRAGNAWGRTLSRTAQPKPKPLPKAVPSPQPYNVTVLGVPHLAVLPLRPYSQRIIVHHAEDCDCEHPNVGKLDTPECECRADIDLLGLQDTDYTSHYLSLLRKARYDKRALAEALRAGQTAIRGMSSSS